LAAISAFAAAAHRGVSAAPRCTMRIRELAGAEWILYFAQMADHGHVETT
jgi:hypothetical protein